MNPEYLKIIQQSRRARIIEKRSTVLAKLLQEHDLPEPKSVEFDPLAQAEFKRCFVNVEQQVSRAGGAMETGWLFWEIEDTSVYTEAHAVWITPKGRRRDITPQRLPPDRRLMFLPDPLVAAKRGVTPGYMTMLSNDPSVIALERFHNAMDRILADVFPGFGVKYEFPVTQIRAAAETIGLPLDVADFFIAREFEQSESSLRKFGR